MLLSSVVLATALIGSAFALDTTSATKNTPSSTKSAAVTTQTVSVGANGHHFEPSEIKAKVGDIIEFFFYPQNHSVARAAFKQPCIPYEITGPGRVGFWSDFQPVQVVLSTPPSYSVRVNDTEPIFFYCSAPGACFDGMVGVINPNATDTFEIQHEFTQNATQEFSPGEIFFEPEVGSTRTPTAIPPTSTPTSPGSAPDATNSAGVPAVEASHPHGLSKGAIAGIAIAAIFAVALAAAVIYMCGRQKTMSDILHRQSATVHPRSVYHPASPGYAEAQYPNVAKGPMSMISSSAGGRFSETPYGVGVGEDGRSFRSSSPPIDERTGMIMNPSGFPSPRSDGAPLTSPGYSMYDSYEGDGNYKPLPHPLPQHLSHPSDNFGPHELPVPSRAPSNAAFSFTDSDTGHGRRL